MGRSNFPCAACMDDEGVTAVIVAQRRPQKNPTQMGDRIPGLIARSPLRYASASSAPRMNVGYA